MSIPVEVADIGRQMDSYGAAAFVLSVRADSTPHIAHCEIRCEGEMLLCAPSKSTAANVAERPVISLLWPPFEPGGYSMIVDVDSAVADSDDGPELQMKPVSGVLHRPAAGSAQPAAGSAQPAADGGRAADCAPIAG